MEPARPGNDLSQRINAVLGQLRKGRPNYQKCFAVRQGEPPACVVDSQHCPMMSRPRNCELNCLSSSAATSWTQHPTFASFTPV